MSDLKKILGLVGCAAVVLIFVAFAAIWIGFHRGEEGKYQQGSVGLCKDVPQPYKSIFEAAGSKWKVQPAFIAAIFYAGEHGESWPKSPDGPWASSKAGAQGPFQFMPATWESNKQDGNGDGVMDVQNLWDSAFAAAHLLANIGAGGNTTDIDKLKDAASKYNSGRPWSIGQGIPETAKYVPRVIEAYQKFFCATLAGSGDIVAIARAELGTKESYDNCDCGDAVLKYGGTDGDNWCAYFASWVYTQAGYPITFSGRGSSRQLYDWFKKNQIAFSKNKGSPQAGDIAYWDHRDGTGHVGIVESYDNDGFKTIEGNTSRHMVAEVERDINEPHLVGFARWKR